MRENFHRKIVAFLLPFIGINKDYGSTILATFCPLEAM